MKLANDERETIITFDETPADAIVFTYSKSWQKHIEGKLGIRGTPNGFGGKEYQIPKARIRMPMAPRKLSPQQREKIGQRLRAARQQKDPNPSGNHVSTRKPKAGKLPVIKTTERPSQGLGGVCSTCKDKELTHGRGV